MPGQQDVETPDVFFKAVENFFNISFSYDMAADCINAKVDRYFTEDVDALTIDWPLIPTNCWLWLNPPFAQLGKWVNKVYEQARRGCNIVTIWPLSGDQNQIITWNYASVYILHGRVWPNVRGCMLCVWTKEPGGVIAGLDWNKHTLIKNWRVYR